MNQSQCNTCLHGLDEVCMYKDVVSRVAERDSILPHIMEVTFKCRLFKHSAYSNHLEHSGTDKFKYSYPEPPEAELPGSIRECSNAPRSRGYSPLNIK